MTSYIVDSAAIYNMVVILRNTIAPLHRSTPFVELPFLAWIPAVLLPLTVQWSI
jgi:hypothetical protein